MIKYDFLFTLLNISVILVLVMLIYVGRLKNKSQLYWAFFCNILLMLIWGLGRLIEAYAYEIFGYTGIVLLYFSFIGICFEPVSLFFTGIIYANTRLKFKRIYILLIILPVLSYILLLTNSYHQLVIVKYSIFSDQIINGRYFIIHTIYSYALIFIGLYYLLYFSVKNSGFFSKQSFLVLLGFSGPLIISILVTFKIVILPAYSTAIAFSFAVICFTFAILKYSFLSIVPVALRRVVDHISDSFIVINREYEIIDYNKTLIDTFSGVVDVKRQDNLLELLKTNKLFESNANYIVENVDKAILEGKSVSFEKHMVSESFDKYFTIELTPISNQESYIGTIILLKDITQAKKDLEIIKENQTILIEQERLASLGQLIGGIAHNIRTPIMSISGAIEALKDLAYEYRDSIDDKSVTEQDHKEIAKEMLTWLEKMRPYCAYMSDVISAVKGQAVQMNASTMVKFTVDELIKRVDLLMKHELKKNHITLSIDSQIDMNSEIKGEVSNLIQVFDNIIINAMHAYEGKAGIIQLKILRSGDNIEFIFKDNAKGIPKEITDRLFKEMVTTKGKNGTGLGLYMSYSTVKGRFGGNMSFNSIQGEGTTFFISIPCISYNHKEVS